jgi:hypothetical protein
MVLEVYADDAVEHPFLPGNVVLRQPERDANGKECAKGGSVTIGREYLVEVSLAEPSIPNQDKEESKSMNNENPEQKGAPDVGWMFSDQAPRDLVEMVADMVGIGTEIRTQNNRFTQDPVFQVRVDQEFPGVDPCLSDQRCWFKGSYEDGSPWHYDRSRMDDVPEGEDPEDHGYEEYGFWEEPEVLESCFTEKGAKSCIDGQRHNMVRKTGREQEPYVYAASLHNNPEMRAVRRFLVALSEAASNGS